MVVGKYIHNISSNSFQVKCIKNIFIIIVYPWLTVAFSAFKNKCKIYQSVSSVNQDKLRQEFIKEKIQSLSKSPSKLLPGK